jgi:hypothetical protein
MKIPVTLRSSRKKMLWMLLGSLLFVAAGFWMLSDGRVTAYLTIAFFGLCALVFGISLLPNSSYLRLAREGFTVCSMFRSRFIEWRHVGEFGVTRIGLKKMVGWDPSHSTSKLGRANKAMCGYASALPDTYGMKAEDLADLLNHLRDEHTAQII